MKADGKERTVPFVSHQMFVIFAGESCRERGSKVIGDLVLYGRVEKRRRQTE